MSSKKKSKSKIAKERLSLPQSYLSPKDSDMLKSKNNVGPSRHDPIHRVRQDGDGQILFTQSVNRQPESRKRSANKSDELVKHMSNLPSYLRRPDSGENIQDKTLNVGVLDWSRLEKWKHKQNNLSDFGSKFASFNSSGTSKTFAKSLSSGSTSEKLDNQRGFLPSSVESSYKVGLPKGGKPSFHNAKRFQDSAEHRSSGKSKTDSDISLEEKRKGFNEMTSQVGNFASSLTYHGVSRVPNENTNADGSESPEKSWEGSLKLDLKKKDRNHNSISDVSISKNKGTLFGSKKKLNFSSNEGKKKAEQLEELDIESDHRQSHSKLHNIVLLHPRETPQSSSPEIIELSKSRMLIDENFATPSQSSLSNFSLPEGIISEDLFHEYPRSHVLHPTMAEPAATLDTGQCSIDTGRGIDHSSVISRTPPCSNKMFSLEPKGTSMEIDALDSKLTNRYVFSNSKKSLDQETAELTARRDGNSSYRTRFSFSLSRIGRSLSFREGSALPQLSSTSLGAKSGQLTSESSACLNNSSKEKSIGHNRSRSNSFRRFLDPILRNKAPDVHHSAESSQSLKGSLGSISFRSMSVIELLDVEKSERTKSSPLTSESSTCLNNSSKEISVGHNRSRSSSFRRFLDPLLKNKAPDVHHSAESSQSPKGSLGSISFRSTSVNELLDVEKSERTTIKALLQLIMKNGLPSFQFVLNNETNILAAAMKNLASPGKDGSGRNFMFYLVNEIKRKSGGWISQRNKEKHCGYAYNLVGQMKVSSNKITEPVQNSKRQRVVKEHVLSGVEIGQTDEGAPKLIQNQELAAVIIEIPCENLSHKGMLCDRSLLKDRCSCDSAEVELPISSTVILPGGMHGLPDKGEPSPLIYRWKSGGLCDCGGWDIGCKLLVLSDHNQSSESYNDHFQLFAQEGAEQDNKPLFSLVPLKDGLYSVEFDSSITHLQAFFISVVVLSCQKQPNFIGMSDLHEEIVKELSLKTDNTCQGKEPVYYTSIPPLSPVGRF